LSLRGNASSDSAGRLIFDGDLKTASSLLDLVRDKDVRVEEYARHVIAMEVAYQDEVNKTLRKPAKRRRSPREQSVNHRSRRVPGFEQTERREPVTGRTNSV
jgi:hypothetical protein